MRKILTAVVSLTLVAPAVANDMYYGDSEYYAEEYEYTEPEPAPAPAPATQRTTSNYDGPRDTYVGLRIHKNEHIESRYRSDAMTNTTVSDDSAGLGLYVGNRLTDHVKLEFETMYTGFEQKKYGTNLNLDVWSNMLNFYLYETFGRAVEPYAGLGVGLVGLWSNVGGNRASETTLSLAAMAGVNFALNNRVDLNLGVKYQYYGKVEHDLGGDQYVSAKVDATELYIGAAYKFGL